MCFHSMERKALQALCKQHKIPANLSTAEMVKRLEEHFKDKEKSPQTQKGQTNGPDLQNLKRKDLQVLCKQHQIPANLPNHEMIKRLTDLLRENDKSSVPEPINVLDKTESTEMGLDYYSMKYKDLQMLCKKHSIPANLSKQEMAKRLTELIKENEKPSIQVLIKEHDENASETESMDVSVNRKVKKVRFSPDHELFEYTRSPELQQIRRNSVSIRPSNLSVETIDNSLTNIENVDGQGRVTRSRGSNLVEEVVTKTKRVKRAVDIVDNVPFVSGEGDDNIVETRRSFRNKGVPLNQVIGPEIVKMAPEKMEATKVQMVIEPQVKVKRSKRNANAVDGVKGSRKLSKLSEMSVGVLQIEEPAKLEVRKSDRRKSVITVPLKGKNRELKSEMENVRKSVLGLVTAGGVSKDEKNVPQPITKRSRRKTIITEPVASEEILDTDELGGDTLLQQKNTPKKRKGGPTSGEDVVKTGDVRSSLKQSTEEGKNKRSVSVVESQLPESAEAESGSDTGTRNKTVTSDVGLEEIIRKTLREEQVVSVAESKFAYTEENAAPLITELETDDCEKTISASKTKEAGKVDLFEFDVQDMVDNDITNMNKDQSEPVSGYEGFAEPSSATESVSLVEMVDHVGEVEEVSVQENLDSDDHVGEVEEVLVQENLVSDDHVGEVEEVSVQENLDSVEHVGEVEQFSVQENLDSVETGETNVISLEITFQQNNVDYMEASNGISEDNKEDIGEDGAPESFADLEATESEADTGTHPDLDLADDHLGEDDMILVQNLDHMEAPNTSFDKEDGASEAGTPESCGEAPNNSFDKEDGASEAGEVGTPESCDTSLGNLRIIEGEGDDAETEKEECLNEHKIASDEDDEFGVSDLLAGERSVMNASQDGGRVSGECLTMKSDEQRVDKEYLTVSQKTISSITTNICTMRDLEAEHSCREEICIDKSIEVAKTDAGGSPDCHENQEFAMSHILDVERRYEIAQQDSELLSGENSANKSDENDQISEGDKAENNENYENRKDEDRGFGVSNLLDVDKSVRVSPQYRGFFHAVESNKGFNEQVVLDDFPVVSIMSDEVVIGAGSSSSMEISPSKPHSSSKSPGTDPVISDACEIIQNESGDANNPDKEIAIALAEEINNECTPKQGALTEQPRSPSAITTAITNTPMSMSQTCGKEITSPVAEGFNVNEDGNDVNCGNDEDKLENAFNTDADRSMDCTVNNSGAETLWESESHHSEDTVYHQSPNLHGAVYHQSPNVHDAVYHQSPNVHDAVYHQSPNVHDAVYNQSPNLYAKPSQSFTEIEATENEVTPNGLDDSMNKLNANSSNSLTNEKENEMEEETGSESAKSTRGGASLPMNIEDNQLRWLFATPSNFYSLSKVEKTSRHGKELDRAEHPKTECVGTTKENAVAQIKFDENEFEKCSSSGDEINNEEVNATESVELANTSSLVLSEASDEHLTENTCDDEEKEIMSLGESCLYVEAPERVSELTEKIAFSSFGSPRNFDNVEHMDTDFLENLGSENIVGLKSERKLAQTIRAEVEFSDADIQNPYVLENNHHLTATKEDTNLSEDTPKGSVDAERTNIVSCNDEKAESGIPPSLLTKVSSADDAILPTNQKVSDNGSDVDREDYQSRLLYATPIKIDSSPKVNETSKYESDLENSVAGENLQDAENEHELSLRPSSDTGEKFNYEDSDVVECVKLMNTSGLVLSEASEEPVTENTCDEGGLEKSDSMIEVNEEEEIISLGESCLFNEEADLSGSLKNLDKVEGCQDRLMDTHLEENLSCDNKVGAEFEISDDDILGTLEGPTDVKGANMGSFNCEKYMAGASSSLFPKVSDDDDDEDVTERKSEGGDGNSQKMDCVVDHSRSLPDFSDELHNNTLMAIFKSPSVANTLELQNTYKETSPTVRNVDNMLSVAGQGIPVCGAEDGNENGDSEKSDTGTPLSNSGGDHEENSVGTEEIMPGEESDAGTPDLEGDFEENDKETGEIVSVSEVEFPGSDLHLEEQIDVPAAAFGCDAFLKECDVDTTIKEYIDNELTCMDERESGNSGSAGNDVLGVAKEEIESTMSVKENARTILIHGTPSKMVDMKENEAAYKSSKFGDFTAARPAKRKALQDVRWK